ncbi:hypothetical protein Nepgr_012201 [Nepenthes gracilis]|uniref:Uncharacterized protein n=1 Tax=Nepenthes gracilis TaxID=150966 RepID=A0AAD3SGI4_NEPGR|nr:hypothetical protein Nepgr_012201 [Nepenthes gracilis]
MMRLPTYLFMLRLVPGSESSTVKFLALEWYHQDYLLVVIDNPGASACCSECPLLLCLSLPMPAHLEESEWWFPVNRSFCSVLVSSSDY